MRAKFEIVQDDQGRYRFQLLDVDDRVLLTGVPSNGKVGAQSAVLHARTAVGDNERIVPHVAADGRHIALVKDKKGGVIAHSGAASDAASLAHIVDRIGAVAKAAPLVDHARAGVR